MGRSAARFRARRSVPVPPDRRAASGPARTRRCRGSGRRLCAEPERSHLPAAHSRTARACRRSASAGDEPRRHRHAPRRYCAASTRPTSSPFGGTLRPLTVDAGALVPLTFVPPFPTYPPETAWMRQPTTDIPGLVLSERGRARIAYMPADIDRRYAREHLPDHARPAREHRALGGRRRDPARGRRRRADRLPSLRAAGPADPAPRQPDERGDVARADRRAHSRGTVQDYHAAADAGGQHHGRVCWSRRRRVRSPSPAAEHRSRFHRSSIMKLSCWSSRRTGGRPPSTSRHRDVEPIFYSATHPPTVTVSTFVHRNSLGRAFIIPRTSSG